METEVGSSQNNPEEIVTLSPFLFVFCCYFLSLILLRSNSSFLSASLLTLDGREPKKTGRTLSLIGFHSVILIKEGGEGRKGGWESPSSLGEKGSADGAAALALGRLETGSAGSCQHTAICK